MHTYTHTQSRQAYSSSSGGRGGAKGQFRKEGKALREEGKGGWDEEKRGGGEREIEKGEIIVGSVRRGEEVALEEK